MNEHLNPHNDAMSHEDINAEKQLRPLAFDDFTGQEKVWKTSKCLLPQQEQGEKPWITHCFMVLQD